MYITQQQQLKEDEHRLGLVGSLTAVERVDNLYCVVREPPRASDHGVVPLSRPRALKRARHSTQAPRDAHECGGQRCLGAGADLGSATRRYEHLRLPQFSKDTVAASTRARFGRVGIQLV
jgi:hypothetical protein